MYYTSYFRATNMNYRGGTMNDFTLRNGLYVGVAAHIHLPGVLCVSSLQLAGHQERRNAEVCYYLCCRNPRTQLRAGALLTTCANAHQFSAEREELSEPSTLGPCFAHAHVCVSE